MILRGLLVHALLAVAETTASGGAQPAHRATERHSRAAAIEIGASAAAVEAPRAPLPHMRREHVLKPSTLVALGTRATGHPHADHQHAHHARHHVHISGLAPPSGLADVGQEPDATTAAPPTEEPAVKVDPNKADAEAAEAETKAETTAEDDLQAAGEAADATTAAPVVTTTPAPTEPPGPLANPSLVCGLMGTLLLTTIGSAIFAFQTNQRLDGILKSLKPQVTEVETEE